MIDKVQEEKTRTGIVLSCLHGAFSNRGKLFLVINYISTMVTYMQIENHQGLDVGEDVVWMMEGPEAVVEELQWRR